MGKHGEVAGKPGTKKKAGKIVENIDYWGEHGTDASVIRNYNAV